MIPILLRIILDLQTVILFVALLGLTWAYFLLTHKRGNQAANKFLALLIGVLAVFVLRRTAELSQGGFYLFLYFVSQGFIYMIGPSIYFHIKHLTNGEEHSKRTWKHFVPAAIAVLFMSVLFFYRSEIDKIQDFDSLKIFSISFISLQVFHLMGYLFYSRKLVVDYTKKCEAYYSSMSRINLDWIKHLMLITSILGVAIFCLHLLIVSGGYYQINNNADSLFLILLSVIILKIIYKSWSQPEIVSEIFQEKGKYKNSPLSNSESLRLKEKLEQTLNEDRVFLTQELSVGQLALSLGTQSYLLSQLLNEHYKENFFNFINGHRIDFAVKKINQGNLGRITLEAIAYESGFNSKSTFNRAFKKRMGCSPKEYHRSLSEKP